MSEEELSKLRHEVNRLRAQVDIAQVEAVACRMVLTQLLNGMPREDARKALRLPVIPEHEEISPVDKSARRVINDITKLVCGHLT